MADHYQRPRENHDSQRPGLLKATFVALGLLGIMVGTDLLLLSDRVVVGCGIAAAGMVVILLSSRISTTPSDVPHRPPSGVLTSIATIGAGAIAVAAYLVVVGIANGGVLAFFNPVIALLFLMIGVLMLQGWLHGIRLPR